MKKIKLVVVVFLVLVLGVLFIPQETKAATKTMKYVYQQMSKNFMARKKSFDVRCKDSKTANAIIKKLYSTKDEQYYSVLFAMSDAVDSKKTTDDGDYLYGNLKSVNCYYDNRELHFYDVSYFESKKQTKKVNQRVALIAKTIMKETSSKKKRILLAYQYVIDQVRYDSRKNCFFSAYAGLYKKKTVCNGYALLVYKILMKMNIPCKFVSGSLKDGKKWYLHAWNIVKYQGKWYNLDACSDDGDDGEVYLDYFMKTDSAYKKDHKKDFFYQSQAFKKKYKMANINIS